MSETNTLIFTWNTANITVTKTIKLSRQDSWNNDLYTARKLVSLHKSISLMILIHTSPIHCYTLEAVKYLICILLLCYWRMSTFCYGEDFCSSTSITQTSAHVLPFLVIVYYIFLRCRLQKPQIEGVLMWNPNEDETFFQPKNSHRLFCYQAISVRVRLRVRPKCNKMKHFHIHTSQNLSIMKPLGCH